MAATTGEYKFQGKDYCDNCSGDILGTIKYEIDKDMNVTILEQTIVPLMGKNPCTCVRHIL